MTPDRDQLAALFDQARKADIEAVAGVPLFRAGRRLRGECPLCGASKGKRADGAFSVDPRAGLYKCFSCEAGGDVIDLEHQLRSRPDETPRHAAERLVGAVTAPSRPARAATPSVAPAAQSGLTCARIWAGARPAQGTLVQTYLRSRGIDGHVLRHAVKRLRFHPAAPWGFDERRGKIVTAPAMVAMVVAPSGPTGGLHLTYLAADGFAKADLRPAKKMFGPQYDDQGRPGGVWLVARTMVGEPAPLIVAEGIETALSAAMLLGKPARVIAALSLNRLQGGWAADKFGRFDPDAPRADLERPAFTWPAPPVDPWPEVMVAVDRDMAPVEVKVRAQTGRTVRRRLSGEERAQVCAALAAQHWRHAGAPRVRTIAPPAKADFNDQLREAFQ